MKTQDAILQEIRAKAGDDVNRVIERAVYLHRFGPNGGVLGMEPRHWMLIPGCDARTLERILELLEPYQVEMEGAIM